MLRLALGLVLLVGLVAVPAANAASTTQILRDCADDGVLQGNYSPSELRRARQNIPTDTDEYTDCRDVLSRAAASAVAGSGASGSGSGLGGSGGGSGSGFGAEEVNTNTDEGRQVVGESAAKGAPDPVQLDGRPVIPGNAGFAAGAVRNGLPTSLLVVLVLLGAAALAAAAPYARRRVLARFKR